MRRQTTVAEAPAAGAAPFSKQKVDNQPPNSQRPAVRGANNATHRENSHYLLIKRSRRNSAYPQGTASAEIPTTRCAPRRPPSSPSTAPVPLVSSRCCVVASAHAAHACTGPGTRAAAAHSSANRLQQSSCSAPENRSPARVGQTLVPLARSYAAPASALRSRSVPPPQRAALHCTPLAVRAAPCALHTARPTNPLRAARQICTPTPQPPKTHPNPTCDHASAV